MTETEKQQRQLAINRSAGVCYVCGKALQFGAPQYAHRIANTKANRAKYGSFFIDHTMNGEIVCSLRCNDSMNIGNNPRKCLELLADILIYELKKR